MSRPRAVVATFVGLTGVAAAWDPTLGWPPALAATVALAAGVPHGALDHVVGHRLGARGPVRMGLFLAGYVVLVVVGLVGFVLAPLVATVGFLALSGWHFGQGDLVGDGGAPPAWLVASRGAVVLGVPILGHPEAAEPALALLAGAPLPALLDLAPVAPVLAALLVAQHTLALEWADASGRAHVEHLVLAAWLAVAHPLVGFALYFALWHAWPHWSWMRELVGEGALHKASVPTLVSLIGLVALAAGGLWLRAALIGIAALTVPHALLVEVLVRRGHAVAVPS